MIFSAVITALMRPLWYDEIGTATVSGLQSVSRIWTALLNAADAQPPAFFWVTVLSRRYFGNSELGLRLPAIVGFSVIAICLYVFSRRVWGRVPGLVALLVLMCSQGLYYASEARPYGLLLGCLGIAALLWQNRKHGNRSTPNMAGLLGALTAVCAFHYYGVFVIAVFAAVEITLALLSRKPDWAVICGLPLCALPVVFALPLIDATRQQITAGFWGRPSFKTLADGYVFSLVNVPLNQWTLFHLRSGRPVGAGDILLLLFVAGAIVFVFREGRHHPVTVGTLHNAPVELLLATGLLLLPLIAWLAAKAVLGGYTPRYTIGAIAGSAMLAAWIANCLGERSSLVIAASLTVAFGAIQSQQDIRSLWSYRKGETARSIARGRLEPLYRLIDNGTPLVVPDGHLLFESWYYSRPNSRPGLIYLQDRKMAMRFSGSDSYDVVNERLKPYIALHLEDPRAFLHDRRDLLMARKGAEPWSWADKYFDSTGARYQTVAKGQDNLVISRVLLANPSGRGLHQSYR